LHTCLVCGFSELDVPQYNSHGEPMYNICPCCGFQSGYDDDDRGLTFEEFRKEWLDGGNNWFSSSTSKPLKWDLKEQLKRINVNI
jgi:hypothetical protein